MENAIQQLNKLARYLIRNYGVPNISNENAVDEAIIMLEKYHQQAQDANNYLSGGGCGGSSVQRAAELYRDMKGGAF